MLPRLGRKIIREIRPHSVKQKRFRGGAVNLFGQSLATLKTNFEITRQKATNGNTFNHGRECNAPVGMV